MSRDKLILFFFPKVKPRLPERAKVPQLPLPKKPDRDYQNVFMSFSFGIFWYVFHVSFCVCFFFKEETHWRMSGKVVDQLKNLSKMEGIQTMFRMLKHLPKRRFRNQNWKQSILVSEYFEAVSWTTRYRNVGFKMD